MYQLNQIPSEAQIRKILRQILFGKNVFCPECRSRKVRADGKRYWCPRCRRRFTLLSHTWLHDLKLPLQKFWLLLWGWCEEVPVLQAMALTKLSEDAVRRWYGRFRAHLPEESLLLQGTVQMDEAYGKGWALLMAKQAHTRKLAYAIYAERSLGREHAVTLLQDSVRPGSKLHTDGSAIYRNIGKWWPVSHAKDIHKRWEFGKTSQIEGIFGNYRTFIRRMYHHVTRDKVPEYVREFVSRFSSPEIFKNPRNYLEKTLKPAPID